MYIRDRLHWQSFVSHQVSHFGGTGEPAKKETEGSGDVKSDIEARKKDAQQWISEWKESTGGK